MAERTVRVCDICERTINPVKVLVEVKVNEAVERQSHSEMCPRCLTRLTKFIERGLTPPSPRGKLVPQEAEG